MNITECINNRRSSRSFTSQEVSHDMIHQLITLGTKAATGSYGQPWGFVIITDKRELNNLSDEAKKYMLENFDDFPYFHQYEDWLKDKKFSIFYGAPCLLIIYGNTNSHWYTYDCTLAAGNIMLAAKEYGLGTCWIGFAEYTCNTTEFKTKYNIPHHYNLVCPMIIGYPKLIMKPPKRKPATIFFEG